jgi:hypothetical protein
MILFPLLIYYHHRIPYFNVCSFQRPWPGLPAAAGRDKPAGARTTVGAGCLAQEGAEPQLLLNNDASQEWQLLWASTSVSSDQLKESEWTTNLTPTVFPTQIELISYQNGLSDKSSVSYTMVLVWQLVRLSYPLKQTGVRLSDPRHTKFISDRAYKAKCAYSAANSAMYCIEAYITLYCETQSITYYAQVSVTIALSCALLNQSPPPNCPEIANHSDIDSIEKAPLT